MWSYSSAIFFFTSALHGGERSTSRPDNFTQVESWRLKRISKRLKHVGSPGNYRELQ
jgi:hypothetical protein